MSTNEVADRRRRRGARRETAPVVATLEGARQIAAERFGIRALRPEQERLIEALFAGRDALAILPTGFGKSLVYQLPATMLDGPVVVVSPLIALMRDQERSMRARGVPVVRIDSTLRAAGRRDALARLRKGGALVLLTTPETLAARDVRLALVAARPRGLCVDEAHCISEWGHDFRPAYLRLGAERETLGIPTALALTATATPRVASNIADRLRLRDPLVVRAPPHRPNLRLAARVAPGHLKLEVAGKLLRRLRRPGIVYCATTKAVDEVHAALVRARIPAERYHGKMKRADRDAAQRRFMRPRRGAVMVATSAFGMGIDKSDIRYVLHFHVPGSLEQYVQEAGRAGRDGKRAECVVLFDPDDLRIQEHLLAKGRPSPAQLRCVARALAAWAAEARPVGTRDLALSAGVPATIACSLLAALEDVGVVAVDDAGQWTALVPPGAVPHVAEELAARFETLRREDARRLDAIARYCETDECRSVFVRRWFGEESPARCGTCDRCRAAAKSAPVRRAPRLLEAAERVDRPAAEKWTIDGVLEARSAAAALLDRLGLEGYLFEIEPRSNDDRGWELRLEWVRGGPGGAWSTTRVPIDGEALLRSRADPTIRSRILRAWRAKIGAATRAPAAARRGRLTRAGSIAPPF